ncbi:tyrosyl-DNA phosphodiesterase 1-like isoform X2 [Uloborus diversus]|nr:tyrosyl-DNA phosphodiesterase 1-like isoform X2 [Uloborus diversus]
MDSDSDRTIDSDEFEEFLAKKKTPKKLKKAHQCLKAHDISDSDSDEVIIKKQKLHVDPSPAKKVDNRPKCQYGSQCYRKNPDHLREFYHPSKEIQKSPAVKSSSPSINDTSCNMKTQNYNFFVTKVNGIPQRFNGGLSYGIKDLLSFKDGTLIASAHFNYMFDVPWLIQQYPEKYRSCPLTIVHGAERESKKALEKSAANHRNIKFCQAKLDIPFGTHHTKMMFLLYQEGFRIIIHTSNIVDSDWDQKTQGMWVSPLLRPLHNASVTEGESPTNFKSDLLDYISSYGAPELDEWRETIKKHDFSPIRVVLIGSVPGRHVGSRKTSFGHLKVRKILNSQGPSKEVCSSDWPLIAQFSSIGSLGASPDQWLLSEFAASLGTVKDSSASMKSSSLKLVYPSVENVRKSLEGYPAGASLPYSIKVAQKQQYLRNFLHQWKSDKLGRTEASPHIKTYIRVSPDNAKIAWFLLTSANLSKAAWGTLEKKGAQFMIRSYELGVMFLPKYFGMDMFSVPSKNVKNFSEIFPIPFDIPVEPYSSTDQPWIWDIPQIKGPDRYGNKWCPP